MGDSGLCVFDAITSNISRSTLIVHGSCAAPSGSNHCKSISMPPCIASRTMRRPAQIGQPAGSVADIRQSLQVPMEDSLAHLDSVKRLEQLLKDKTLEKEIAQAFEFVKGNVSWVPLGMTVPLRTGESGTQSDGAMLSGTLSQLDLPRAAITAGVDVAKIRHVLMESINIKELRTQIGNIIVNTSTETMADGKLQRANKDGEVTALSLLILWSSEDLADPQVTMNRLTEMACDLVYECHACGSGSSFESRKLQIVEVDERKRNVIGMSAWRKSLQYQHNVDLIKVEGRRAEVKSDADRLLLVLQDDNVSCKDLKSDTLGRYLAVAARLRNDDLQALFLLWESAEGRNALIDNVTTLRQIFVAAPVDADLLYVLQQLYYQQRRKRRAMFNLSHKVTATPGNVARAILVRRSLYQYLEGEFPQLVSVMQPFSSYKHVLDKYGVDDYGMRSADSRVPDDEDSDQEELTEKADDSVQMSSMKSKALIRNLCDSLASNTHEKTLISMVQAQTSVSVIDLTSSCSRSLSLLIQAIKENYIADFSLITTQTPTTCTTHATPSGDLITVQTSTLIESEEAYKQKFNAWSVESERFHQGATGEFVDSHVTLIVNNPPDSDRLLVKCAKIEVLNEKKRKLFLHDAMQELPIDVERAKKKHKSLLSPTKCNLDEATFETCTAMYYKFRNVNDNRESDDVVGMIIPGTPTTTPRNIPAEHAWSALNKLQPKHCTPKMGDIEVDHGQLLHRVKAKTAFSGMRNHSFVFTKHSKGGFAINQNQGLSLDTHLNRWPAQYLPLNQKLVIEESQLQKCFPAGIEGTSEFADDDVLEGYSMLGDEEQTLSGDKVMPWPLEFQAGLTETMLNQFDAQVLVAIRPYSGECLKAVLRKRCWAVGICSSHEHKKLIRERLMAYVKQMHLVDLKDAPQKPQELIVWEAKRRSADHIPPVGTPKKMCLTGSPGKAADPQSLSGFAASAESPAESPAAAVLQSAAVPKLWSFGSAAL